MTLNLSAFKQKEQEGNKFPSLSSYLTARPFSDFGEIQTSTPQMRTQEPTVINEPPARSKPIESPLSFDTIAPVDNTIEVERKQNIDFLGNIWGVSESTPQAVENTGFVAEQFSRALFGGAQGVKDFFGNTIPKTALTLTKAAIENVANNKGVDIPGFGPIGLWKPETLAGFEDKSVAKINEISGFLDRERVKNLAELGVGPETSIFDPAKFTYSVTSGLSSVALAVTIAMATKNPTLAAVALGGLEGTETYNKARAKGKDPETALNIAAIDTAGIVLLEKLGLEFMFKSYGGSKLYGASVRAVLETIQEESQLLWSTLVEKMGFNPDMPLDQLLTEMGQTFVVTLPVGFIAGGAFEFAATEETLNTLNEEFGIDTKTGAEVVEKMKEGVNKAKDEFGEMLERASADQRGFIKVPGVSKEVTPEGISPELQPFIEKARKFNNVKDFINSVVNPSKTLDGQLDAGFKMEDSEIMITDAREISYEKFVQKYEAYDIDNGGMSSAQKDAHAVIANDNLIPTEADSWATFKEDTTEKFSRTKAVSEVKSYNKDGFAPPLVEDIGDGFYAVVDGHHRVANLIATEGNIDIPVYFDSRTLQKIWEKESGRKVTKEERDRIYKGFGDAPTTDQLREVFNKTKEGVVERPQILDGQVDFDLTPEQATTEFRKLFNQEEVRFIVSDEISSPLVKGEPLGLFTKKPRLFSPDWINIVEVVQKDGKVSSDTVYHESFHAFFNNFVEQDLRKEIFAQIKANPAAISQELYPRENYISADERAEEWMADDFAKYVRSQTTEEQYGGFLRQQWERLLQSIRTWIRRSSGLQKIYDQILAKERTGVFTDGHPISRFKINKRNFKLPSDAEQDKIFIKTSKWIKEWIFQPSDVFIKVDKPDTEIVTYLSQSRPKGPIKLFRGVPKKARKQELGLQSWTRKRSVAEAFAKQNNGKVIEEIIQPNRILVDFRGLGNEIVGPLLDASGTKGTGAFKQRLVVEDEIIVSSEALPNDIEGSGVLPRKVQPSVEIEDPEVEIKSGDNVVVNRTEEYLGITPELKAKINTFFRPSRQQNSRAFSLLGNKDTTVPLFRNIFKEWVLQGTEIIVEPYAGAYTLGTHSIEDAIKSGLKEYHSNIFDSEKFIIVKAIQDGKIEEVIKHEEDSVKMLSDSIRENASTPEVKSLLDEFFKEHPDSFIGSKEFHSFVTERPIGSQVTVYEDDRKAWATTFQGAYNELFIKDFKSDKLSDAVLNELIKRTGMFGGKGQSLIGINGFRPFDARVFGKFGQIEAFKQIDKVFKLAESEDTKIFLYNEDGAELVNRLDFGELNLTKVEGISSRDRTLKDPNEDGSVFFHGTSKKDAESLIKNGFDPNRSTKPNKESPDAFFIADISEADMFGGNFVAVRKKSGEIINTIDVSSQEWADVSSEFKNGPHIRAELKRKGFDAENSGDEIAILNTDKFEIFDPVSGDASRVAYYLDPPYTQSADVYENAKELGNFASGEALVASHNKVFEQGQNGAKLAFTNDVDAEYIESVSKNVKDSHIFAYKEGSTPTSLIVSGETGPLISEALKVEGKLTGGEREEVARVKEIQRELNLSNLTVSRIKKDLGIHNIKSASDEQLDDLITFMDTLEFDDKFLTPMQMDALEDFIDLSLFNKKLEFITQRELQETYGELTDIAEGRITKFIGDDLFPSVDLKENNPLVKRTVDRTDAALIQGDKNAERRARELDVMFKKAEKERAALLTPKERIARRLVPQHEEIFRALSGESVVLTPGEVAIVARLHNFFAKVRGDQGLDLDRVRQNYITHMETTWSEKIMKHGVVDGLIRIVNAKRRKGLEEVIPVNIMIELDNIIGSEKFFRFALAREGGVDPSFNLRRVVNSYSKMFEEKMALDRILPEGQAMVQLLLKPRTAMWQKRFLQNVKGRGLDFRFRNGKFGWLSKVADNIVVLGYFKLLALNHWSGITNWLAGTTNSFINQDFKKFITGKQRFVMHPKKAIKIANEHHIMEGAFYEYISTGLLDKFQKTRDWAFIYQRLGEWEIRAAIMSGEMTEAEWESGKLTDERVREIKDLIAITQGMFTKVDSPLWVQTWYGRLFMQMNRWRITNFNMIRRIGPKAVAEIRAGNLKGPNATKMLKALVLYGIGMWLSFELQKAGHKRAAKVAKSMAEAFNSIVELFTTPTILNMFTQNPTLSFMGEIFFSMQELADYIGIPGAQEPRSIEFKGGIEDTFISPIDRTSELLGLGAEDIGLDLGLDLDLDLDLDLGLDIDL